MESLYSWSDLPPTPLYGLNWGHKIADLILLPYISFIITFTALERISYKESLDSWSDLPLTPSYGSNWGHKRADFVFLPYISFKTTLLTNYSIIKLTFRNL